MDAIQYILSLDWELRDANGVLIPLKMILSSVTWSAKSFQGVERIKFGDGVDFATQEIVRNQILICLSNLFRTIGNQRENLFSPMQLPLKYGKLIQTYESFFMSVFTSKEVGLKLVKDQGYWLHFELKHPLYVYNKISEVCIVPQTD